MPPAAPGSPFRRYRSQVQLAAARVVLLERLAAGDTRAQAHAVAELSATLVRTWRLRDAVFAQAYATALDAGAAIRTSRREARASGAQLPDDAGALLALLAIPELHIREIAAALGKTPQALYQERARYPLLARAWALLRPTP